MKPKSHIFGRTAESLATHHLQKKGYRILGRNVRLPGGELDLIAKDGKTLVFVEVKARQSNSHGGALYSISQPKQRRLIRLAAQYLAKRNIIHQPSRFDVVLCQGQQHDAIEITHIENAFEVPGEDLRW